MSKPFSHHHVAVLVCCLSWCLSCSGGAASASSVESDRPSDDPGEPTAPTEEPDSRPSPQGNGSSPGPCNAYSTPVPFGHLPQDVDEASGLAVLDGDDTIFWLNNDSGNLARVYAVDIDGRLLTTLLLDSIIAIDWEDMSRGPCDADADGDEVACLFIGDIGDNYELRDWVTIHRLTLPQLRDGVQRVTTGVESMRVVYPDHPHDAEALVVDEAGRVAILTKDRDGTFSVYSAPFGSGEAHVMLEYLATVDISSLPGGSRATVTAADYDPVQRRLIVRTYNAAIEFRLAPDQTLADLGAISFEIVPTVEERQGESIAYGQGGYWHVSEGEGPPLYFARCLD